MENRALDHSGWTECHRALHPLRSLSESFTGDPCCFGLSEILTVADTESWVTVAASASQRIVRKAEREL